MVQIMWICEHNKLKCSSASNATIVNNRLQGLRYTVYLQGASADVILMNNVIDCSGTGCGLFADASRTLVSNNIFTIGNNKAAVYDSGIDCTFSNNIFYATASAGYGFRMSGVGGPGVRTRMVNNHFIGTFLSNRYGNDATYTATTPAINMYRPATLDASSNAIAATLADGTYIGQSVQIVAVNVDNAVTLSVATHETSSPEVGTFGAVGQSWELKWNGTKWVTLHASCTF